MRTSVPLDGSVLGLPVADRSTVPVWLLDVDGVLNAATHKPDLSVWPSSAWVKTSATAGNASWPILTARPVLDFVAEVHAAGAAEIRWHTTWREAAATSLAPTLGLPDFPVQEVSELGPATPTGYGGVARGSSWWKMPAAEQVVASEKRALLWTDDDILYELQTAGLGAVMQSPDRLLISPQTTLGLTPRHLKEIRHWLGM